MKLPAITGMKALESDGKGTVTFILTSNDGRTHYVPVRAPVLNAMTPTFLNIARGLPDDAVGEVQATTLTAASGARLDDGTKCLSVSLDGVPLLIALSEAAIRKLKVILIGFDGGETQSKTRH